MFKKKISLFYTLLICVLVAAISVSATYLFMPKNELSKKTDEILRVIYNNFDGEISEEALDKAVFTALVNSLNDKYGAYYYKEDGAKYLSTYKKENSGLGVTFTVNENKNMLIVTVNSNSPADKAGIMVGDEIIAVDNLTTAQDGSTKIREYIASKSNNQTVNIKVIRDKKELSFTAVLGIYQKQTVFYNNLDGVGYIKITRFDESTLDGFKLALNNLKVQNVKGIIFDLRNNGGGTVDSVCDILDILLPECNLISAKYKNGETKVLRTSDKNEENFNMVVLTNKNTASASELFTAAIREIKNGTIIGENTYCKWKMQTMFTLSDGSVVKISVAKFYSPLGNNFDEVGIEPDINVQLTQEQQDNFYLLTPDSDPVILKGIECLK